ncbi:MAG: sulfatase-like hydrolase/transferase, partial [Phycisphaerae bacterium]
MNEYPQIPENGEPVTSARGVVTPVGGLLVGMLAATVCSCVDVILVAFSGKRIPWGYAPSVVGVYLVAGGLAGLILVLVQKLLYRVLPASTHDGTGIDRLQRACLIAWVTILAVPFVERLQRPFVPGFGASISTVSLVVLVAGFLASAVALVARRPAARRGDDRLFAWKVACLAMGAMMWHPFSNLYTAPALSVTSLGANAFFLGILVALYVVGRRLFRGPGDAFHSTNPARWNRRLAATAALAVGAVGVAWAVRGMVERHPIDLRRTYATSGASIDSATRPDVVLIVMDTVRADHASAYGYHRETTPNLERFARHAVRYDRAVAGSSWTLPSHATLFTGLLPTEHGAHYDEFGQGDAAYEPRPLSRNHHTLAELLLEAGYYTGAVIGNSSVVNREFGFDQGFLYFDDRDRIALDTAVPNVPVPSLWLHQAYLRLVGSDGYH